MIFLYLTQPKHIKLDISRPWPPVTYSSFAYSLSSVTYQGPTATATPPTPAAVVARSPSGTGSGSGSPAGGQDTTSQPKGVIVYANTAIPAKVRRIICFSITMHIYTLTIHNTLTVSLLLLGARDLSPWRELI